MTEKPKVMVVDDDRRMVRTICDILRVKGYRVEPTYGGEEAVDKVKECAPDCVLMDIKMRGIDGVKALKMMKRVVPGIQVVLMSANASDEQLAEAKLSGSAAFLAKPVEIDRMIRIIDDIGRKQDGLAG